MARRLRTVPGMWTVIVGIAAQVCMPFATRGFTLLNDRPDLPPPEAATRAARWNAAPPSDENAPSLHDGILVGASPDILDELGIAAEVAERYGVAEERLAELARQAVVDGVRTWEHGALRFEVRFDRPVVPQAPQQGNEIDVFVGEAGSFFGVTNVAWRFEPERMLTNGQTVPGNAILGADITINRARVADAARLLMAIGQPLTILTAAFQVLVAHEVGHALGLGHPNEGRFLDDDADPYNILVVDPWEPTRNLRVWPNPSNPPAASMPIMWGGLSQANPTDLLALLRRLADPRLAPDDVAGRDVLYPMVESPSPTPSRSPTASRTPTPLPTATFTPPATPTASVTPTTPEPACAGDCSGDGAVTVDELVLLVNIALELAPLDTCTAADTNGDRHVTIEEIVGAVNAALYACPS